MHVPTNLTAKSRAFPVNVCVCVVLEPAPLVTRLTGVLVNVKPPAAFDDPEFATVTLFAV